MEVVLFLIFATLAGFVVAIFLFPYFLYRLLGGRNNIINFYRGKD